VVDDKLCHRLVIEAFNEKEALSKAEDMGVYFDGCEDGRDCSCCGDRWSSWTSIIDISQYKESGYPVSVYGNFNRKDTPESKAKNEDYWRSKYGMYKLLKKPEWKNTTISVKQYIGALKVEYLEQYLQFRADENGWTSPDIRIFYLNGKVTEIFSRKIPKQEKKKTKKGK
jgi:hypothetical protein